ncbi:MAG: hypothetical protein Q8L87_01905 [Anaerolineales bacterium]|nr:hypothetical protein [Anaerolineales bacterium]
MTTNNTKMNIPVSISAPGESYWASVHVYLHSPWFLVVYEIDCKEEDFGTVTTALVSRPGDIVTLGEAVKITQVAIVTPAWMNKTKSWKMDFLKEICEGFDPRTENIVNVCITKRGARYRIGASDTPESELIDLHRVF